MNVLKIYFRQLDTSSLFCLGAAISELSLSYCIVCDAGGCKCRRELRWVLIFLWNSFHLSLKHINSAGINVKVLLRIMLILSWNCLISHQIIETSVLFLSCVTVGVIAFNRSRRTIVRCVVRIQAIRKNKTEKNSWNRLLWKSYWYTYFLLVLTDLSFRSNHSSFTASTAQSWFSMRFFKVYDLHCLTRKSLD